jgi:hypothetical protein
MKIGIQVAAVVGARDRKAEAADQAAAAGVNRKAALRSNSQRISSPGAPAEVLSNNLPAAAVGTSLHRAGRIKVRLLNQQHSRPVSEIGYKATLSRT